MKVWRIEHKTKGFGPLCDSACDLHKQHWEFFARHHIAPWQSDEFWIYAKADPEQVHHQDVFDTVYKDWVSGCISLESLQKIFT